MKYVFVKGAKAAVVWNPVKNKPLAEFVKGEFETNDSSVAKALRKLGYKEKRDFPNGPPPDGFPPEPPSEEVAETLKKGTVGQIPKTESEQLSKSQTTQTTKTSKRRKSVTVRRRAKQ